MRILYIFFVIFTQLQGQSLSNIKITYTHSFKVSGLDSIAKKTSKIAIMKAFQDKLSNVSNYELIIGEHLSKFQKVEKIDNSQSPEWLSGIVNYSFSLLETNMPTIIKDFENNLSYTIEEFKGKQFSVSEKIKPLDWRISRNKKQILNYEVREAKLKLDSTKTITAWYAPQLNNRSGPINFHGLPGLILSIESESIRNGKTNKNILMAKKVEYLKKIRNNTFKEMKNNPITKKKFEALLKE